MTASNRPVESLPRLDLVSAFFPGEDRAAPSRVFVRPLGAVRRHSPLLSHASVHGNARGEKGEETLGSLLHVPVAAWAVTSGGSS